MTIADFPTSQSELIRRARGDLSQVAFARLLGIDRSCLSRYESEALGAPTSVVNYCLRAIAGVSQSGQAGGELGDVLINARRLVEQIERLQRKPIVPSRPAAKRPGKAT